MNKSLSRSFRTAYGNQHDDALERRVKPFKDWVMSEYGTTQWLNWAIRFNGTLKMIQGDDENVDVVQSLRQNKLAGSLKLTLLPKLKAKDLSPITDELLRRGSDLDYHPIVQLNLTGTAIKPAMLRVLVHSVLDHQKYPWLTELNLTQTGLSDKVKNRKSKKTESKADDEANDELHGLDACTLLAVGLRKNKALKCLYLNKNPSIGPEGLQTILESISKHDSLRLVRYNSNQMKMEHAEVWGQWLATNPNLVRISLENNGITDDMFQCIVRGLATNTKIFELAVPQNQIGDDGIAALSKHVLMNPNTNLMRLILFENAIMVEGAKYLSEALAVNWTVTELDLSQQAGHHFDDEAVNILCEGLKSNESLHTLRLGDNELTSVCCTGLGQLLSQHPNLAKLEVYRNPQIGSQGFECISKGLEHNSRLWLLSFAETSPGKEGAVALNRSLRKQYLNTSKLIEESVAEVRTSEAVKASVVDNDIENFSDDLIEEIFTFVGYSLLKELDIRNCYKEELGPGVQQLIMLMEFLEKHDHTLVVRW